MAEHTLTLGPSIHEARQSPLFKFFLQLCRAGVHSAPRGEPLYGGRSSRQPGGDISLPHARSSAPHLPPSHWHPPRFRGSPLLRLSRRALLCTQGQPGLALSPSLRHRVQSGCPLSLVTPISSPSAILSYGCTTGCLTPFKH